MGHAASKADNADFKQECQYRYSLYDTRNSYKWTQEIRVPYKGSFIYDVHK